MTRRITPTSIRLIAALWAVAPFFPAAWPESPKETPVIAFASFAPVDMNIYIANGDGTNARPLLQARARDYNPSYSHDGAWIVFTSERGGSADIYRVHPDGAGLERLTVDPAFDDQGALSPDGGWLAFVSTRGGEADIWLMDLKTRHLQNLTAKSAGNFRPAWSPDGQWIAFSSDRDSRHPKITFGALHSTEIYVMRRDGSELRRITRDGATAGSPTWSEDGSQIIFYLAAIEENFKIVGPQMVHGDMRLVSVSVASGERRVLADGLGEKWYPRTLASAQIAYVSGGESGGLERIGGAAGARGEFKSPGWAPDGKTMVFHREERTPWPPFERWTSREPGFQLIRTGIFPSFSPSGDRLVCNSGTAGLLHNSILVMNADGSNRSVLFDDPQRSALAPSWSPRGDQIAFGLGGFFQMLVGNRDRAVPAATSQLAVIRSDGSGLHVLTSAGEHAGFPSWSPDAKRIVYRAGTKGKGLRIIDAATEEVAELTDGQYNDNFPAWSPVDDRIAFTSDRDGDYEIYTIRSNGTDLKRLTRSAGNDAHPGWSPDGEWIAFASARTGYRDEAVLHPHNTQPDGEIYIMRADGSDIRRLTENQFEDATPAWRRSRVLP